MGPGAVAVGPGDTAVGTNAMVLSDNGTAVGDSAMIGAGAMNATVMGQNAQAMASGATAIGQNAQATNVMAVAIGQGAIASGSTAVGGGAVASGANSAAFGMSAMATGANSTALGENSSAVQANTTAVGQGVATTRANQVSIGNAANTYTLSGVASSASRAAQTGPTQVLTTDANGNIAGDAGAFAMRLDSVEDDTEDALQGVALAIALTGSHLPQPGETVRFSMNLGHYEGKSAFSASGAAQVSDAIYLTGGIGVGLNEGNVGGRVGVSFGW